MNQKDLGAMQSSTVVALRMGFQDVPAVYLGQLLMCLGSLYSSVTDENLSIEAVGRGSIVFNLRGSSKLQLFASRLKKILGNWFEPEKAGDVVEETVDALVSRLAVEHRRQLEEIESLQHERSTRATEVRLKVVREYPAFLREMVGLKKEINPDVTRFDLQEVAHRAAELYGALFSRELSHALLPEAREAGIGIIDSVKDRISLDFPHSEQDDEKKS